MNTHATASAAMVLNRRTVNLDSADRVDHQGHRLSDPEPFLVNASDAARLLGISRALLWQLHSAGKIPLPIRLSRKAPRWSVEELKAWITAGAPDRDRWIKLKQNQR